MVQLLCQIMRLVNDKFLETVAVESSFGVERHVLNSKTRDLPHAEDFAIRR